MQRNERDRRSISAAARESRSVGLRVSEFSATVAAVIGGGRHRIRQLPIADWLLVFILQVRETKPANSVGVQRSAGLVERVRPSFGARVVPLCL